MVIQIPLSKTSKTIAGQFVAFVDDKDEDLAEFNWSYFSSKWGGYAIRSVTQGGRKRTILMHRVILARMLGKEELESWENVDHIDNNPRNNRRENLRLASESENAGNSLLLATNISGFKGVSYDAASKKRRKRWRAVIHFQGKHINLGRYLTKEEAKKAYDEAALEYFQEFANDGTGNIFLKRGKV